MMLCSDLVLVKYVTGAMHISYSNNHTFIVFHPPEKSSNVYFNDPHYLANTVQHKQQIP